MDGFKVAAEIGVSPDALSSLPSWIRGSWSTPDCRQGSASCPEHECQISRIWSPSRPSRRTTMELLHPKCARLDVHKETVVAGVRIADAGKLVEHVQTFSTTTKGLLALSDYLSSHGVT